MTYDLFARFANSWGLVFLALAFAAAIAWAFRPGSKRYYRQQADIPFRDDTGDL
ncbi:MAG: CcoQ/FixQ family Cbb3-type cytochrome c oxidase assembly chaperone [Bauldia sp.]